VVETFFDGAVQVRYVLDAPPAQDDVTTLDALRETFDQREVRFGACGSASSLRC
jgi:hypothetical protein